MNFVATQTAHDRMQGSLIAEWFSISSLASDGVGHIFCTKPALRVANIS